MAASRQGRSMLRPCRYLSDIRKNAGGPPVAYNIAPELCALSVSAVTSEL